MPRRLAQLVVVTFALIYAKPVICAEPRIELHIYTAEGLPTGSEQDWYQLLTQLGIADLQFRGATAGQQAGIVTRGSATEPTYQVTGLLTARNELVVPGGRFTTRDRPRLSAWVRRLKEAGPEVASTTRKLPFDLSPALLAEARRALRRPLTSQTAGEEFGSTYVQLVDSLGLTPIPSGEASSDMRNAEAVADELRGISCGTALAAVLRPLGLAFAPRRSASRELVLVIFRPAPNSEIWPIGWNAEERRRQLLPKLFEFLNAEIEGVSVAEAVETVRARLDVPLLYDHNALARYGIDLQKIPAKMPAKRTSYSLLLQKVLGQAKLKLELRTDDAGKPFFWVTSVMPIE